MYSAAVVTHPRLVLMDNALLSTRKAILNDDPILKIRVKSPKPSFQNKGQANYLPSSVFHFLL